MNQYSAIKAIKMSLVGYKNNIFKLIIIASLPFLVWNAEINQIIELFKVAGTDEKGGDAGVVLGDGIMEMKNSILAILATIALSNIYLIKISLRAIQGVVEKNVIMLGGLIYLRYFFMLVIIAYVGVYLSSLSVMAGWVWLWMSCFSSFFLLDRVGGALSSISNSIKMTFRIISVVLSVWGISWFLLILLSMPWAPWWVIILWLPMNWLLMASAYEYYKYAISYRET